MPRVLQHMNGQDRHKRKGEVIVGQQGDYSGPGVGVANWVSLASVFHLIMNCNGRHTPCHT